MDHTALLKQLAGRVQVWIADVECGLKPTLGSLYAALTEIDAALERPALDARQRFLEAAE